MPAAVTSRRGSAKKHDTIASTCSEPPLVPVGLQLPLCHISPSMEQLLIENNCEL